MAGYINSSLEDVKVHIANKDFDGPIDLLAKLVSESEIDIMDIFISDVISQYIEYIKKLSILDYDNMSEFILYASLLIKIKANKLTPQVNVDEDDFDYEEAENEIIEEVREKLLKECPEKLRPLEVINVFYPEPVYDENDYKLVTKNMTLDKLLEAYKLLIEKNEIEKKLPQVQEIVRERFTIIDKYLEIKDVLTKSKRVSFFSLFRSDFTKLELINCFLAILQIVKNNVAFAEQAEDNDINLKYNTEFNESEEELDFGVN